MDQIAAIVAGLSEASFLVDADLKAITYNEAFTMFVGMRRRALEAELRQRPNVFELLGPDGVALAESARAALSSNRSLRLEEVQLRSARGASVVGVALIPLMQGSTRCLLVTFRDVTAEARLQVRYKELIAQERARGDELERAVAARTQELSAALEEVTRLSRTDPLTGLLNRRSFLEMADAALELAKRHERCTAFLVCDLDFFKQVNDTYGHDAGDRVLVGAAKALQGSLRKSDRLARFGGEEFVILLTETERDMVQTVADRFVAAVRAMPMQEIVPTSRGPQTVSIGAAIFPDHGGNAADVITRADQALYAAKHRGRNQAVLFEEKLASTEVPEALPRALWCGARPPPLSILKPHYDVTVVASESDALHSLQRNAFDAVVVDAVEDDGRGAEVVQQIAVTQPNAVRAMLVSSTRDYVSLRSAVFGSADVFMLNEDVAELPRALADARARRQARKPISRGLHVWQTRGRKQTRQEVERICRDAALRMVYQPIVRLGGSGRLGVEALSRVHSETFKNPGDLFEAALEVGLLWTCSRLVRRRVAEEIGKLPAHELLFLNLHPADFDDPEFVAEDGVLAPFRNRIVLELTERATVPSFERFAEHASYLRRLGFRIAVDDLGAGYASLNSLALIEPDFIKIDMSITRGIAADNVRGKLVRRIVEFANDSRAQVIIEGVETEAEAAAVGELGCHYAQGFYFAQPEGL